MYVCIVYPIYVYIYAYVVSPYKSHNHWKHAAFQLYGQSHHTTTGSALYSRCMIDLTTTGKALTPGERKALTAVKALTALPFRHHWKGTAFQVGGRFHPPLKAIEFRVD